MIQFILFLEHFQKTQSAVHESNKSKQIHAAKNTPTIHKMYNPLLNAKENKYVLTSSEIMDANKGRTKQVPKWSPEEPHMLVA